MRAVGVLRSLASPTFITFTRWQATLPRGLCGRKRLRCFFRDRTRLLLSLLCVCVTVFQDCLLLLSQERLESAVGFTELLYDLWSLLAVARGVVCWVHRIYD